MNNVTTLEVKIGVRDKESRYVAIDIVQNNKIIAEAKTLKALMTKTKNVNNCTVMYIPEPGNKYYY